MNILKKGLFALPKDIIRHNIYTFARLTKQKPLEAPVFKPVRSPTDKAQSYEGIIHNKADTNKMKQEKHQHLKSVKPKIQNAPYTDEHRELNTRILTCNNIEALKALYLEHREQLNAVNLSTCLNRMLILGNKAEIPRSRLKDDDQIIEILSSLKERFNELNDFGFSNVISNMAKLDILDSDMLQRAVDRTLQNHIHFNEKSVVYILWSLCKLKIRDEKFLDFISSQLTKDKKVREVKSLANIFWAMSQLDYRNQGVLDLMQHYIFKEFDKLDSTDVNLVFAAYATYGIKNLDILDHLAGIIIRRLKKMSFRNLANLSNYCSILSYTNPNLLNHIEREVVKRLKKTPEFQEILKEKEDDSNQLLKTLNQDENHQSQEETKENQEEPNEEGIKEINTEAINDDDVSQILVSFCKMKIVKPELFELLEMKFIKNSIVSYAFAHSALCLEMMEKYETSEKQFLRRSLKNLKKFHDMFYELTIPVILTKTDDFTLEQIQSLLISGSRPLVTKRILKRGLLDIGIQGVPKIETLKSSMPLIEYEKTIYRFGTLLKKYIFKQEQQKQN